MTGRRHDHNALWLEEVKLHYIGYNVRGHKTQLQRYYSTLFTRNGESKRESDVYFDKLWSASRAHTLRWLTGNKKSWENNFLISDFLSSPQELNWITVIISLPKACEVHLIVSICTIQHSTITLSRNIYFFFVCLILVSSPLLQLQVGRMKATPIKCHTGKLLGKN